MSKKSKPLSEYNFKDDNLRIFEKFKTIQKVNVVDERVFVKGWPSKKLDKPTIVANILDKPEEVNWNPKNSHTEETNGKNKSNYKPALMAGSFWVCSGTFVFSKESNEKAILFPLDASDSNNPAGNCEIIGNMSSCSIVTGSVDAPTWVGYVTTRGSVGYNFQ